MQFLVDLGDEFLAGGFFHSQNRRSFAAIWLVQILAVAFDLDLHALPGVGVYPPFCDREMVPGLSVEIITTVFFFGAVFVIILSILISRLFGNIFCVDIDDTKAYRLFAEYVGMQPRKVMTMACLEP